jgi:DNA-binding XRE family transcriptional regulator
LEEYGVWISSKFTADIFQQFRKNSGSCQGEKFLMGLGKTERPACLAEKLLRIREKLGLSQTEMCAAIQKQNGEITMYRSYIAQYEAGRVPGPLTLLAYAKIARITIEDLVDDKKTLPKGF